MKPITLRHQPSCCSVGTTAIRESRIWMTLAINPCEQRLIITGLAYSEAECVEHADRTDAPYVKSFDLSSNDAGDQIGNWLVTCGITRSEAGQVVRDLGAELTQLTLESRG
jgi:hypothetical protein